jgi:hypothetical protein
MAALSQIMSATAVFQGKLRKNLKLCRALALATAGLCLILSAHAGTPPTKIFKAITITVPGSYMLANDISGTLAIYVESSNVDINLNKHTVNGAISISTYEPDFTTPVLKVRVYNWTINGSILFIGGSYCLINNLTITADYTQGQNTGIIIEGEYPKYGSTATVGGSYNRAENCSIAISSMAVGQSPSAPDRFPDIVPSYAFF